MMAKIDFILNHVHFGLVYRAEIGIASSTNVPTDLVQPLQTVKAYESVVVQDPFPIILRLAHLVR